MRSARRVGLLGGTFDPIHCGHAELGRAVAATVALTDLIVLPTSVPPHRPPPIASGFHRFAMASLAVLESPGWRVSDLELARPAPTFTSDTLAWFRASGYRPSELFLIVGADAFAGVDTWKDYPAILDAAHFAVVSRPGHPVIELARRLPALASRMAFAPPGPSDGDATRITLIDAATADISSTEIRARCAAGRPIDGLVSPAVAQHIVRHGLYSPLPAADEGAGTHSDHAAGRLHGKD